VLGRIESDRGDLVDSGAAPGNMVLFLMPGLTILDLHGDHESALDHGAGGFARWRCLADACTGYWLIGCCSIATGGGENGTSRGSDKWILGIGGTSWRPLFTSRSLAGERIEGDKLLFIEDPPDSNSMRGASAAFPAGSRVARIAYRWPTNRAFRRHIAHLRSVNLHVSALLQVICYLYASAAILDRVPIIFTRLAWEDQSLHKWKSRE